jgi:type III pantothenate kinase
MEMNNQQNTLVVDAGNTSIKIALFEGKELSKVTRFEPNDIEKMRSIYSHYGCPPTIIASVRSSEETENLLQLFENSILATSTIKLPITLAYETKTTLGIDRICNAVSIHASTLGKNAVCFDIGTCLKVDCVTHDGIYLGGSIAPGIDLRFKSLHDYTAKLPLISEKKVPSLVGKSTTESILSGVMNGMQAEVIQLMEQYRQLWPEVVIHITGGDAHFFDFLYKKNIKIDENLTLKGLFNLYLFNAH